MRSIKSIPQTLSILSLISNKGGYELLPEVFFIICYLGSRPTSSPWTSNWNPYPVLSRILTFFFNDEDKEYIMNLLFLSNMDKSYFSPRYNQRFGTNTVFFFLMGSVGERGEDWGLRGDCLRKASTFGRGIGPRHISWGTRRMGFRAPRQAFGNESEGVAVERNRK